MMMIYYIMNIWEETYLYSQSIFVVFVSIFVLFCLLIFVVTLLSLFLFLSILVVVISLYSLLSSSTPNNKCYKGARNNTRLWCRKYALQFASPSRLFLYQRLASFCCLRCESMLCCMYIILCCFFLESIYTMFLHEEKLEVLKEEELSRLSSLKF